MQGNPGQQKHFLQKVLVSGLLHDQEVELSFPLGCHYQPEGYEPISGAVLDLRAVHHTSNFLLETQPGNCKCGTGAPVSTCPCSGKYTF